MSSPLKVGFTRHGRLQLTVGTTSIFLGPEELALIIQRLIQEGQLYLTTPSGDWLFGLGEVGVVCDDDGVLYLTPEVGSRQPSYTVAIPEPYADSEGRICNPWGV